MQSPSSIAVRFWGVRGSIACPGPETVRYGGNTPCLEVRCGSRTLIFDGGTGLRPLGNDLLKRFDQIEADIFLSHCHLDHVIGIPFFAPFFGERNEIRIWAGHLRPTTHIEAVIRTILSPPIFPLNIEAFKSKVSFHDFHHGETLKFDPGIEIKTVALDHPDGATGYRVEYAGRAVVYLSDLEATGPEPDPQLVSISARADLLIYDATYTERELASRAGWGHSTWERGVRLADAARAKTLCLFHHDPDHNDQFMDTIAKEAAAARPGTLVAREGETVRI